METISARYRIAVYLAGDFYCSRKTVLEKSAEILKRYNPGDYLDGHDFQFAFDLLCKSPRAAVVMGVGVDKIEVYTPCLRRNNRVPGKSYRVFRKDGTTALVSFKDCLLGKMEDKGVFIKAAQIAVEKQITQFSNRAFSSPTARIWCPGSKRWVAQGDHEVIYDGAALEAIVDRYLEERHIDLNEVRFQRCPFRKGVAIFADVDDKREWQQYHARHANLRVVLRQPEAELCLQEA